MFASLISLLFKPPLTPSEPTQGLLLGLDGVGKRTLLSHLAHANITTSAPRPYFIVKTAVTPTWHIISYDVGGCSKDRPLWKDFFPPARFLLFLVDCTDGDRLVEAVEELCFLLRDFRGEVGGKEKGELVKKGVFILLVKQDLLGREVREVRVREIGRVFEERLEREGFAEMGLHVEVLHTPELDVRRARVLNAVLGRVGEVVGGPAIADEKAESRESYVNAEKAALPPAPPAPPPTREELLQRVEEGSKAAEPDDDAFWSSFIDAEIPVWDHFTHLRAGYFILLPYLFDPSIDAPLVDAADDFVAHLSRLHALRPEQFGNTAHRTMTMFWLAQLESAAREFDDGWAGRGLLKRGEFADVLRKRPELMDGGLWKEYYSREVMFSREAREALREPDLKGVDIPPSGGNHVPRSRFR